MGPEAQGIRGLVDLRERDVPEHLDRHVSFVFLQIELHGLGVPGEVVDHEEYLLVLVIAYVGQYPLV